MDWLEQIGGCNYTQKRIPPVKMEGVFYLLYGRVQDGFPWARQAGGGSLRCGNKGLIHCPLL